MTHITHFPKSPSKAVFEGLWGNVSRESTEDRETVGRDMPSVRDRTYLRRNISKPKIELFYYIKRHPEPPYEYDLIFQGIDAASSSAV